MRKTQGLPRVAVAVRRRRLACHHIEHLRARIAELQTIGFKDRFARHAVRNLKVAGTQLKEIAARSNGDVFDEPAFNALPRRLQRRIVVRLENVGRRMAAARDRARPEEARDPAFRCVRDYERCREEARVAQFWCHLSMVVCLVGTMVRR